jgi:hypothetical protein
MAAANPLITIMKTVLATPPTTLTKAKSLAPAGPIGDTQGNSGLALIKLEEASNKLVTLIAATDASDPQLTQLNAVQAALLTSTSPASAIANMTTAINAGQTAATTAKALAPGGPIVGYASLLHSVRLNLNETKVLLTSIVADTDASDPNLTAINNVLGVLV